MGGKVHLRTPPTPWDETCLTLVTSLCYCTAQTQKPLVPIWWWNLTRPRRRAFRYSTPPIPSPLQMSVGGRKPSLRSTPQLGVVEKLAERIRTLGKCFGAGWQVGCLSPTPSDNNQILLSWWVSAGLLSLGHWDACHLTEFTERKGKKRRCEKYFLYLLNVLSVKFKRTVQTEQN